jgi:hypothetical protein
LLTFFLFALTLNGNANGQLLVGDRGTNQISKYDAVTGEFQGVLVSNDFASNGGLLFPSAMSLGPNNELFVATQAGTVLRYNVESGEFLGTFANNLNVPSGLLYDTETDELLVSTLGQGFDSELVLRYNASTGELLSEIGTGTGRTGRTGMALGPDGNLYVSSFADEQFFLGSVMQFDGETYEANGTFAALVPAVQTDPFLAGASSMLFRSLAEEGEYELDVVGLFSRNVARFGISTTDDGLVVNSAVIAISSGLVFPSAIVEHPVDGTILISNLGNDDPMQGEFQGGWVARYEATTGEFIENFINPGGDGSITQPSTLLILPDLSSVDLDCNGDGVVNAADLTCACSAGLDETLAELNLFKGDFDGNREVAFPDFLVLAGNFGEEGDYSDGDANCNGTVEFSDFLALSTNFGKESATAAASVPEPKSILLVACGIGILFVQRRRR